MEKLRLLLLEDMEMDAALIQKVLQRSGMDFEATIVPGKEAFLAAIENSAFDVILADHSLPQFDAASALHLIKERGMDVPFILVTGTVSEEFAVNIMMAGAWDYILKDRMQRLPNAILNAANKYSLQKQQKKTYDELIKNEALMKKSERLAHLGSWETDMSTYSTRWSDENYRILDYGPGEATPSFDDFLKRVHPEDKEFVKKTVEGAISGLNSQKYNCRVVHKDGAIKYLENELFIIRGANNKITHLNGFSRDVTLQTETNLSLIKSQKEAANYKYAIDQSSSVAITDQNGMIIKVNDNFCKIAKYSRAELVGQDNRIVNSGYHSKEFMQGLWATIANGKVWKGEIKNKAKDGTFYWVSTTIVPILNDAGKPHQYLSIKKDITKRKEGELQEKQITADLVQRNNALEQFAYITSHNLRGPVTTILGIANAMKDETLDAEEKSFFMNGITASVKKLDDVIIDLNDIINAKNSINEKKELVHFSLLVNDITAGIAGITDADRFNIKKDFTEIDSMVTVKSYMHSIFYNLISNSLKYKERSRPLAIEITSRKTEDKIELIFKDNGMGIDMLKKGDQVFGLYKRFHAESTEGKGMGLFMVKTQVETLGGKISVDSEVNVGTEFRIEFEYNN